MSKSKLHWPATEKRKAMQQRLRDDFGGVFVRVCRPTRGQVCRAQRLPGVDRPHSVLLAAALGHLVQLDDSPAPHVPRGHRRGAEPAGPRG